ncbi:gamma-tubulin complex component 5 [Drosophila tropicalis]|uniref:gamma-tubulin complex component 5 n=1 Tax=Drosophila tropicalis TaxID=46794 RepID=UPI0035AC030B
MSEAAGRNALISEDLRKLIPLIISQRPEITPEQFRIYEEFAWSKIRNIRCLSTNGHAVRRTLEALVERFHIESMAVFGDALRHLYSLFLEQPKWREENTEVDVQWSMLDFLLALTTEPIQNVRRNRLEMNEKRLAILQAVNMMTHSLDPARDWEEENDDDVNVDSDEFVVPSARLNGNSSESLSEWSDDAVSDESNRAASSKENLTSPGSKIVLVPASNTLPSTTVRITQPLSLYLGNNGRDNSFWCKLPKLSPLEPPRMFSQYEIHIRDENLVPRLIHSHWWRSDIKIFSQPQSTNPLANFAIVYVEYLNKKSYGMLHYPLPNTTSEKCLLREIIFMFFNPTSCCFFKVERTKQHLSITVRSNVSICSVTASTMKSVLEVEVLPALISMMDLRHIISEYMLNFLSIENAENGTIVGTGTMECFAVALRDLIQPIEQRLIAYEGKVKDSNEITSLMSFIWHMKKDFKMLQLLHHLATTCIVDTAPPHLKSAYLLSQLYTNTKLYVPHQKLATALLLFSLKRYCGIMDAWWQRAHLEDWRQEFIVERRHSEHGESDGLWGNIQARGLLSAHDNEQNAKIYEQLKSCPFYRLLLDHALESGETQDLLASVNRLGEMLSTAANQNQTLHAELTARLFSDIGIYCGVNAEFFGLEPDKKLIQREEEIKKYDRELKRSCSMINDQEILGILTQHLSDETEEETNIQIPHAEVCQIFDALEKCTQLQLIYDLPRCLDNILRDRRNYASFFAMQYYREHLNLAEHVRFLRHIMFLEADYLLYPFYTQLFRNIESCEQWANSAVLTMELYDIIVTRYADMAGQLHVELVSQVRAKSSKIYEALDAIELVYDMPIALQKILTPRMMSIYNSIWRLMLKVKWAAWKLENLRFIRRSDPYAPLDLLGLTVRRLEILRFWLNYLINSLHTHLCTHVMQAIGEQFERQLHKCTTIGKLYSLHNDYLELLAKHCLLSDDFVKFQVALEQLLHLIFVLDMEWASCRRYVGESHALSLDLDLTEDSDNDENKDNNGLEYLALNQVVEIENTYIKCHQTLAEILQNLVHKQEHGFLSALEVVINSSVPY